MNFTAAFPPPSAHLQVAQDMDSATLDGSGHPEPFFSPQTRCPKLLEFSAVVLSSSQLSCMNSDLLPHEELASFACFSPGAPASDLVLLLQTWCSCSLTPQGFAPRLLGMTCLTQLEMSHMSEALTHFSTT